MISSPKRRRNGKAADWYEYYAGYSAKFVADLFAYLGLPQGARVMDPWNGTGTTTSVARQYGYDAFGYDINPTLVVIAKGRLCPKPLLGSLGALTEAILSLASQESEVDANEPLGKWFSPATAAQLRQLERAIYRLFLNSDGPNQLSAERIGDMPSLAALFYTAAFKTIRSFLRVFGTTNPTWLKMPQNSDRRPTIELEILRRDFAANVSNLASYIRENQGSDSLHEQSKINLAVANSAALPLMGRTIDAVITSPPYCTRIDYVVATHPELSFLGCAQDSMIRELRDKMIGTPTITAKALKNNTAWGDTCLALLRSIRRHQAKASSTYYLRYFTQYFSAMYASLAEIARCSKRNARCVLVVQDSYYKDVRVDLANILTEMAVTLNLRLDSRFDFRVPITRAATHKHAKTYRTDKSATESVLIFTVNKAGRRNGNHPNQL